MPPHTNNDTAESTGKSLSITACKERLGIQVFLNQRNTCTIQTETSDAIVDILALDISQVKDLGLALLELNSNLVSEGYLEP